MISETMYLKPFTGRRRPGSALLGHLRRHRADHDPCGPRADRSEGVPLLRRLLARIPRRPRLLATHHGTDIKDNTDGRLCVPLFWLLLDLGGQFTKHGPSLYLLPLQC